MEMLNWLEDHSGAFTALSALASAIFAWAILKVERGRDLPANQIHGWVTGHGSPIRTLEDEKSRDAYILQINLKNNSKLPIYTVKMKIRTSSNFLDNDFSLGAREVIYKYDENIVQGDLQKSLPIPVRPKEILIPKLKTYLSNSHPKIEVEHSKIEELASILSIEISFRDSNGNHWKRKFNGKLKRKYLKDLINYLS
jgi:hypothetical protein